MARDKKTEDQIIEAAHKVFQEEGFVGECMQKIADTANINKGLLHYYFKSKDKLFFTIFSTAVEKMVGKISGIFNEEIPLFEKIDKVVDGYFDVLSKNSFLPAFVISELNKNPERITDKIMKSLNRPNL